MVTVTWNITDYILTYEWESRLCIQVNSTWRYGVAGDYHVWNGVSQSSWSEVTLSDRHEVIQWRVMQPMIWQEQLMSGWVTFFFSFSSSSPSSSCCSCWKTVMHGKTCIRVSWRLCKRMNACLESTADNMHINVVFIYLFKRKDRRRLLVGYTRFQKITLGTYFRKMEDNLCA